MGPSKSGASGCLSIVASNASITNQVFVKFISRLKPRARSDIVPPKVHQEDRMKEALARLAEFIGEPSIATRDPNSSLSFSCVTYETSKSQMEILWLYGTDETMGFSPLQPDGRPLRKYGPHFLLLEPRNIICSLYFLKGSRTESINTGS